MKQYEVKINTHVIINAEDFEDARQKFKEKFPLPITPYSFQEIENSYIGEMKEVIGVCEISELAIFYDDDYESDGEGVTVLKRELL